MSDKVRPTNIAAERAVLAGICQYGNDVYCDIADIVTEESFTTSDSKALFKCTEAILAESDRVDISSVMSAATSLGYGDLMAKKDMADYVKSIFMFSIDKNNVRKNASMIKKLEMARSIQDIVKNMWLDMSTITGTEPIGEIMRRVEGPILNLDFASDSNDDRTRKVGDSGDKYFEHFKSMQGKSLGIPSPWVKYNHYIGGGRRPGYVYLIGARPKVGKTQTAISDGLFVAMSVGIPVLYIDTEMREVDMTARMWANLANIPTDEIESGSFETNDFKRSKVKGAKDTLNTVPFYYRKVSGKPFEEILSIIRKWVMQEVGLEGGKAKPCMVIYDYFKLMDPSVLSNMQEYQALGFQISSLTDFCSRYDIPCSAYVQINRDGIDKDTSDVLSQSDRLLWLCASVALLKRKSVDEINLDGAENGNLKLIVTQDQRFGPGMEDNDYINLKGQLDRCIIEEGVTRRELKVRNKDETDSGFEVIEDDEDSEDGFKDSDFDVSQYRDDQYRPSFSD